MKMTPSHQPGANGMILFKDCIRNGISCYAVRMEKLDRLENIDFEGMMLWPEVLLFESKESAAEAVKFLNELSLHQYIDVCTRDGELREVNALEKEWREKDHCIYVSEPIQELKEYLELYRVPDSEVAYKKLLSREQENPHQLKTQPKFF